MPVSSRKATEKLSRKLKKSKLLQTKRPKRKYLWWRYRNKIERSRISNRKYLKLRLRCSIRLYQLGLKDCFRSNSYKNWINNWMRREREPNCMNWMKNAKKCCRSLMKGSYRPEVYQPKKWECWSKWKTELLARSWNLTTSSMIWSIEPTSRKMSNVSRGPSQLWISKENKTEKCTSFRTMTKIKKTKTNIFSWIKIS